MSPDPAGRGSARERTALAWRRTGLALLVLTVTLAKVSPDQGRVGALLWLLAGVPGSVVVLLGSVPAGRVPGWVPRAEPWWRVVSAAATAVLLGVLCLVHVLGGSSV